MRNIQKSLSAALLLAGLAGLSTLMSACASDQAPKEANMAAVNSHCPIQADDPVNPSVYTMWHGKKVAFCCPGCIDEWDHKTDDQKAALLEKAK
ncbi:MAG: hypothetical protein GC200_07025 [Tepidisphaera sp.]|nr:hypothetical protein [Tepidisphaera sp.]